MLLIPLLLWQLTVLTGDSFLPLTSVILYSANLNHWLKHEWLWLITGREVMEKFVKRTQTFLDNMCPQNLLCMAISLVKSRRVIITDHSHISICVPNMRDLACFFQARARKSNGSSQKTAGRIGTDETPLPGRWGKRYSKNWETRIVGYKKWTEQV